MNTHIHQTITGEIYEVKAKGGRRKSPDHTKRNKPIIARTTEAGKNRFMQAKNESGMSESAFAEMLLFRGLDSFLNQETV